MMRLVGIILGTALVLGMVLIGMGCAPILGNASENSPTPTGSAKVLPGEEFVLPVGQSVTLSGENLVVEFLGVATDSRSPIGAQTIWAGEAKIQLEFTYRGAVSDVTLTEKGLTDGYTQDSFKQYGISFKLEPYPEVSKQPAANDYKLLMKITLTDTGK